MKTLTRVVFAASTLVALSLSLALTSCSKDEKKDNKDNKDNNKKTEALGDYTPTSLELTGATPSFKITYGDAAASTASVKTFLTTVLTEEVYNSIKGDEKLKNLSTAATAATAITCSFKADKKFEAALATAKVEGSYEVTTDSVKVTATVPALTGLAAFSNLIFAKDMKMKKAGETLTYDIAASEDMLKTFIGILTSGEGVTPEQKKAVADKFDAKKAELVKGKFTNILTKKAAK
ncbi:MAG: hypothetical protein ACTTKF_02525 [Bacteroides sp.]